MPQHRLDCSCGASLAVDTTQAGEKLVCSACQAPVQVPAFRELKQLPLDDDANPTPPPAVWTARRNLACVAALCVTAAALIGLVTSAILRRGIETNFTKEDHIQLERQSIEQMGVHETLLLWENINTTGLEVEGVPNYVVYAHRARWLNFWIIACGVILIAGLGALFAVFRTARAASADS